MSRKVQAGLLSLALAVGVGLALWLARSIVNPMAKLTTMVTQIASGDLNHHIDHQSPNEIGTLAGAVRDLCASLRRIVATPTRAGREEPAGLRRLRSRGV